MRGHHDNTPPQSVNGDEILNMEEDDEMLYMEEVEEVQLEDLEAMVASTDDQYQDDNMEPPEDHACLVFNKHTGSVFCCDFHPDGKIAVSGGEDDKAYVWSVDTGEVIMECFGHKDSIVFSGFSFDGVYLATADMAGLIKVWKCNVNDKKPWEVAFEYETEDISWGTWHFGARVLLFGTATGDIYVLKVPSGETKVLQGHNVKVECGKLFTDGVRLVTGYEDGVVKIWDLKSSSVVQQVSPTDDNMRITAVDTHPENHLVAAIASDGQIALITPTNGKIVGKLEADIDLETVAFAKDPQLGYFAIGTLTGAVSIWDIAKQMVRHQCTKVNDDDTGGVTKMIWIKNHLVTGCLDGSIRIYEGRSGNKSLVLTGHRSEVLDLCYNAKTNLIMTSSDDGTARLYKYELTDK